MATDLSFLEPAFANMAKMSGIIQNIQEGARQQDELAERKRAATANEAIASRHADIAQSAQDRQQQQDDFANSLKLNSMGAQPLSGDGTYTQAMPAPQALPQQAGGGLPLRSAPVIPQAPVQVQPDPSDMQIHFGGKLYRIPSMDEQTVAEAGRQAVIGSSADDVKLQKYGVTLPPALEDEFGIAHGSKVLPDHLNALAQIHAALNPTEAKAEKEPNLHFETTTNDAGDKTTTGYHPVTGAVVSTNVQKGVGQTEAAKHPERDAKVKTATPGQVAGVEKDKAAALAGSQAELDKELAGAQKQYNADSTFDRVGAIKQAYANHYARQQQAQLTYEARQSELAGQDVGHNDWADRAAAASAAQPGATPAAAAKPAAAAAASPPPAKGAAPKTATMADVDAFAKANKMTRADAIKAAQKQGYKIGQVQ